MMVGYYLALDGGLLPEREDAEKIRAVLRGPEHYDPPFKNWLGYTAFCVLADS